MGVVANLVVRVSASVKDFEQSMAGLEKTLGKTGAKMKSIGSDLTKAVTLPIAALGTVAIKAATDFETSFAGIGKTVDGVMTNTGQLTVFGKDLQAAFRNMAKEIPVSVNELNKIGEAAGSLGIGKDHILDFTKVMAQLGATTNLTSDQAATGIAQIQNQYQKAGIDTDKFAAALVALGNAGASTESQILEFAARMGGAANQLNVTQAEVLGWSNAMASVGINAELGSTAWNKVISNIGVAVDTGSDKLTEFAKVAGMTEAAFKNLFKTDASEALTRVVEGFGRIKTEGGNLTQTMLDLGMKTAGIQMTFKNLAGASDMVRQSLVLGKQAWIDNTAMLDEFNKRASTTSAKFEVLKNVANDVAIQMGNALAPSIATVMQSALPLIEGLGKMVELFASLPQPVQTTVIAITAFAAALGPLLYIFGTLVTAGGAVSALFGMMSTAIGVVGPVVAAFVSGAGAALVTFLTTTLPAAFTAAIAFLGPQGLIAVALIALGLVWYKWGDQISAVVQKVYTAVKAWLVDKFNAVVESIRAKVAAISEFFREMYDKVVGHSYVPDMIDGIRDEFARLPSVMVEPARSAATQVTDAFKRMRDGLKDIFSIGNILEMFTGGVMSAIQGLVSKAMNKLMDLAWAGLKKVGSAIWHGIQGIFGNDEEARDVNPARDAFLSEFGGGGTGAGSGFMNLAAQLTEITGEEGGGALFKALTQADTMAEFNSAVSAIKARLKQANAGVGDVTESTERFNAVLTGSDEAIAELGRTQERVVAAMLAGFDRLIAKLDQFASGLGSVGGAAAELIDRVNTSAPIPRGDEPTSQLTSDFSGREEVVSYANEGRVTRPTLAMIGDASEPEYVLHESTVKGLMGSGGGVTIAGGISVSISGTNKNPRQLAREIVPAILEEIGRFNTGGSRRTLRVIAGTA